MSDDPYKAPENQSAPKIVTNHPQRAAVIYLANMGGLAAAWWMVDEKHRVISISAMILFILLSDTIWSFVWPVTGQVDEHGQDHTTDKSNQR